jgi:hypothetical protein
MAFDVGMVSEGSKVVVLLHLVSLKLRPFEIHAEGRQFVEGEIERKVFPDRAGTHQLWLAFSKMHHELHVSCDVNSQFGDEIRHLGNDVKTVTSTWSQSDNVRGTGN